METCISDSDFVGVEMAIEMAALYIHMFRIAASRGMSLMDVNALEEELTNYTYNISMYITIARSAVLIPLYIMFMRRDKGRSMINGNYTKYEKLSPNGSFCCRWWDFSLQWDLIMLYRWYSWQYRDLYRLLEGLFLELTGMWTFSGRMTMCQK